MILPSEKGLRVSRSGSRNHVSGAPLFSTGISVSICSRVTWQSMRGSRPYRPRTNVAGETSIPAQSSRSCARSAGSKTCRTQIERRRARLSYEGTPASVRERLRSFGEAHRAEQVEHTRPWKAGEGDSSCLTAPAGQRLHRSHRAHQRACTWPSMGTRSRTRRRSGQGRAAVRARGGTA